MCTAVVLQRSKTAILDLPTSNGEVYNLRNLLTSLSGPAYFYFAELWPTHLRAQGYTLGIGAVAVTNIIWLEAAPTAFAAISYYYYVFFIIITAIATVVTFLYFPNTLHKPLEEIAAMFGDDDLVVLYQANLTDATIYEDKDAVFNHENPSKGSEEAVHIEHSGAQKA